MKKVLITGGNVGYGINYNIIATYDEKEDRWIVEENGEVMGYYDNMQIDMFFDGKYNTEQYIYNIEVLE